MNALLWKDYRVNRLLMVFGMTLLIGPYFTVVAVNLFLAVRFDGGSWRADVWQVAAMISLFASLLTCVGLGGNAFAGERADRSAEFLACLPVSRAAAAVSRLVMTVAPMLVVWLVNLAVIYAAPYVAPAVPWHVADGGDDPCRLLPGLAASMVLLFGAAWLASSMLSSPALSASCGIFATLFLWFTLLAIDALLGDSVEFSAEYWFPRLALPLGLTAVAGGFAYYLRRVEP